MSDNNISLDWQQPQTTATLRAALELFRFKLEAAKGLIIEEIVTPKEMRMAKAILYLAATKHNKLQDHLPDNYDGTYEELETLQCAHRSCTAA